MEIELIEETTELLEIADIETIEKKRTNAGGRLRIPQRISKLVKNLEQNTQFHVKESLKFHL